MKLRHSAIDSLLQFPQNLSFLCSLILTRFSQQTSEIGRSWLNKEELPWEKMVECAKVDPSSGCTHVIRGTTEEEVLKKAAEHAKQHGIREVTPELKAKVKAAIRDEK